MRSADNYVRDTLGKDLIAAEVGVLGGEHALEMLQLPLKKLYLIDPWNYYTINEKEAYTKDMLEGHYKKVLGIKEQYPIVEVLRMGSLEAVEFLKEISFDYVYIDANHERPYVDNDISSWWKLVKNGGVLGGHDYHMSHVYAAVNEFLGVLLPNTRIIFMHGNYDWIIHKI